MFHEQVFVDENQHQSTVTNNVSRLML